jgi:hypothetical protein
MVSLSGVGDELEQRLRYITVHISHSVSFNAVFSNMMYLNAVFSNMM